jgi:hypothetical protein
MADTQISGLPYKLPASTDKIPVQSAGGATSRLLLSDTQQFGSINEPGAPLVLAIGGGGSTPWTTAAAGPYQGVVPNVAAATDRLVATLTGVYRLALKATARVPLVADIGDYTFEVRINGALTKQSLACCVTFAVQARFATIVVNDFETLASGDYVDLNILGPAGRNIEICCMALTAELVGHV